jgi:carbonic anhydrase
VTARSEFERILDENRSGAAQGERSSLPAPPRRRLAVVACMDARLTVEETLGMRTGDAHIIRNAGGLATDDAIRSIVISQQLLQTEEVIVIGHTGCGMLALRDDALRRDLTRRTGRDSDLPLLGFTDLEESVREQVNRIKGHPWTKNGPVNGLIFEIDTGRLREVT